MRIHVTQEGPSSFRVDPISLSGSPVCGIGKTMDEALGDFVRGYQKEMGIEEITLDEACQKIEYERQERLLNTR